MAFCVINHVKAAKENLPGIVMDVQRLGLDDLRAQPGFRSARLHLQIGFYEVVAAIDTPAG
jgi:hypothetical protein